MAAVPAAQVAAVLDMNSLAAFEQLLGGLTSGKERLGPEGGGESRRRA